MKENILVLVLIGIFIGMPLISADDSSFKLSLSFDINNPQAVSLISAVLLNYSEFTGDQSGDYEIVLLTEDESLVLGSQFINISEADFWILSDSPELLNFSIREIYFSYDDLASKLKVYYKNAEILSVNLSSILCNNNNICDRDENYLSCSIDCTQYGEDGICNSDYLDRICDLDCFFDIGEDCESVCNGIDDNNNGVRDEGCDNDRDGYVNSDMTCTGSFYSKISNTGDGDNVTGKVKTDGKGIINLTSGWNLVSFPVASNILLQDLIDNCKAIAYEYDSNLNDYVLAENINSGKAYWIYKDGIGNCNFDINKYGLLESVNVNMKDGWNLVPGFEDLEGIYNKNGAGVFWSWDGNYYQMSTSLDSTRGVWVYWDKNKKSRLVSCSRVDKDDNNAEINI